jgi:DNA-binding SARP family transcriptional activator/predicted ATPase
MAALWFRVKGVPDPFCAGFSRQGREKPAQNGAAAVRDAASRLASVMGMEPLRIHLFGGFLLERGEWSLPPIASRAGRSLFAYLVMHRDRPLQRDYVAGTFWPELPDGRARRRLSHTIWQIQDVVNTGSVSHLDVTSDTLAFDKSIPFWLDVEEFNRNIVDSGARDRARSEGLDAARLRSSVDLYRGDFMAGYFDEWVLVEQDHFRQRYLTALRRLVDAMKAEGAYEEALSFARRLTHHDPLSEEAHQEVMRLSFLLGRTNDAIEQFERCRSVLEEELGAEPSAPTVAIYEKILRQRRAGIRPLIDEHRSTNLDRRADTPFVGREDERRLLVDSLERVLTGSGGVVLIEGEPGVGKTRLTMEAAEDARWRGFEVSWGSCTPGTLRPFAPLIEILQSLSRLRVEQLSEQVAPIWLGEAMRLAPGLGGDRPPESSAARLRPAEASSRMKEALVHTLSALGGIAPHLLVLDDIQWADQDTLEVLTQIGPRLADSRVHLMLIYRSEEARGDAEVWDVLRDLDRAAGLGRVVLSPLSVFELDEMVRRLLGVARLDPSVTAQLHRQTGGNVLFTIETLLAMRDRGLFESGEDPVRILQNELETHTIPLAPRVRSVIESRMSLLGVEVAEVYELAAVCGDSFDLRLLEAATDLPRPTVLGAVDELLYRGLIREDGTGRYRIAHDQVRQVVYESIDNSRRALLHTVVAETLAESDPDNVEAIGHHFREGGDVARAAAFLQRAGQRAVGLNAYATARHYFQSARQAGEGASLPDHDRYGLLSQLEDVLNVLGARSDQHEILDEMEQLAGSLPRMRGDLERRRAWLRAQEGNLRQAEESARYSASLGRSNGDRRELSNSLVALGTVQRWSGRALEAVPNLEEAVASAADEAHRADALAELASTLVEVQRANEALPHLAEADRIYQELDDLRGQAEVAGIEARALHQEGDRDPAILRYQAAIALCQQIGYRHGEGVNLTNLSNLQQLFGSVAQALDGYDRAARIFEELGNRRGEAMVLANSASARHNLLGEDSRARVDATKAMTHFADIGDLAREAQCQEIVAGIMARDGDRARAIELLQTSLKGLSTTGNVGLIGQHLRTLALIQIENDDVASAHATLDEAEAMCDQAGLADLAVELMSVRAMAHLAEGHHDEALARTRKAVAALSPGVERAYLIHHRHALAAGPYGEPEEARSASLRADALLREALAGLSTSSFQRAVELVPAHREIVAAASRNTPHTVEVRLPRADAPTGRPLDDHDLQVVQWTIQHPDDDLINSPIDRRRHRLIRLLDEAEVEGAAPSIDDLANALAVSDSTVRRDLSALRKAGHRVITRGQRKKVS